MNSIDTLRTQAIRARIDGVWDHPALVAFGEIACLPDLREAISFILDADEPRQLSVEQIRYIEVAREKFEDEGTIEIDDYPTISPGDDSGAYVSAWLWVAKDEL